MGDVDSLLERKTRRVRELEAEVERLREALRFYRDAPADELAMDEGERAKAALGETEAE